MYIFSVLYMICRLTFSCILIADIEHCHENCEQPDHDHRLNLKDKTDLDLLNIIEILFIAFIAMISATQSFISFKLGQLVYILPYNYKWQQFYALACACIASTLYYAFKYMIWIILLPLITENRWLEFAIQCLKFSLSATLYSFILCKTIKTIKKISNSKITAWAVLTNFAEIRQSRANTAERDGFTVPSQED